MLKKKKKSTNLNNLTVRSKESRDEEITREAEKRERLKNFTRSNVGGEPTFNGIPGTETSLDVISALNYYSKTNTHKESYEYLSSWVSSNYPHLKKKLKDIPSTMVGNRGFLCRMLDRGFTISVEDITSFIINYEVDEEPQEKPNEETVKKVINKGHDDVLLELDDIIDHPDKPIQFSSLEPKKLKIALDEVETIIKDFEPVVFIDPDNGREITEDPYSKSLMKRIRRIKEYIAEKLLLIRKSSVKVPKNIPPAKMVENLVYKKDDPQFKSINPTSIIGKKKLYVLDRKKSTLRCLISLTDNGFMISGTTIKNLDETKSSEKRIFNLDLTFLSGCSGISDYNKLFTSLGKKVKSTTGRINEDCILIAAS